jgi:drug/metabolite transporter (DMT)-like permease
MEDWKPCANEDRLIYRKHVVPAAASMKRSIAYALAAALLFGASTPAAKLLAGEMPAFLLAGLLYAGSGLGLAAWMLLRRSSGSRGLSPINRIDLPWLAGATLAGGVAGPVLLMLGLAQTPAATASLLLNLEGAFTALIAWFAFRENFDRRIALGLALILAGGALLSYAPGAGFAIGARTLCIAGACLAWAIDNNLTRRISAGDAVAITTIKGLVAGTANLAIAFAMGAALPASAQILSAGLIGLLGYGVSLALFVIALRELGAARAGAYFSIAPFAGVVLAVTALGETPGTLFWIALPLVAAGVWLHVTEHHAHAHAHEPMEHAHAHVHDEHHRHEHDFPWDGSEPHAHAHKHGHLEHSHAHYPDIHHRHGHDGH